MTRAPQRSTEARWREGRANSGGFDELVALGTQWRCRSCDMAGLAARAGGEEFGGLRAVRHLLFGAAVQATPICSAG
jgi:hypothetical protein